ncbi:small nuclear ribonucleoprotein Sm D3 [Pimephales promelas]|nr:small nuclear ribonucleoprotein Sm D3 [Pimephales promelas]
MKAVSASGVSRTAACPPKSCFWTVCVRLVDRQLVNKMSIGVPIKVLHEAEGHIVTCETNTGEVYRGKLIEAEDNMNCQMANITVTYRDGRVSQLEQVYIRGSKIRFLILPDMLKNAPMLKSMKNKNQAAGAGRGKAAILKAQVAARGRGRGGPGRGNVFQKRR